MSIDTLYLALAASGAYLATRRRLHPGLRVAITAISACALIVVYVSPPVTS